MAITIVFNKLCPLLVSLIYLQDMARNCASIDDLEFHVKSSENDTCAQSCATLSKFAANFTHYFLQNHTDVSVNIEVTFQSGSHTLNEILAIHNIRGNFSMNSETSAIIECTKHFSHLSFENISGVVFVSNISFVACGGNKISYVDLFIIEYSTFEGVQNSTTTLDFKESNAEIFNSTFSSNIAGTYRKSVRTLEILNSRPDFSHTFSSNSSWVGGAIIATRSNITLVHSVFSDGGAYLGGAIFAEMNSTLTIISSIFMNNYLLGTSIGGAIHVEESTIKVLGDTVFAQNYAFAGGAIALFRSNASIYSGYFTNNSAFGGGAIYCYNGRVMIKDGLFSKNTVSFVGGVIYAILSDVTMDGIYYDNNALRGAILNVEESVVSCIGSTSLKFIRNTAINYSILYIAESTGEFKGNITISDNFGTVIIFNSNITFSGMVEFRNCSQSQFSTGNLEEGGAITAFQSELLFEGLSNFHNNYADTGGALHLTECKVYVEGLVVITSNIAFVNGGGIFLYQSEVTCQSGGTIIISKNKASDKGGGIFAVSSIIKISTRSYFIEGGHIEITGNNAEMGGGILLEANAKIYIFKMDTFQDDNFTMIVDSNIAVYGGAVYVDDDSSSGVCNGKARSECFLQVLALHQDQLRFTTYSVSISNNSAQISGSSIFGGLFDRCTLSPFAELHHVSNKSYQSENRLDYLREASNLGELSSISSYPVRVCLCVNNVSSCSYRQINPINVKKGETFTLSLVAVDQIGQAVDATIQSSLDFTESGLAEGQLMQRVTKHCTDLKFSIVSPQTFERLTLYASDGPCRDAELSSIRFDIEFVDCFCPLGFQVSKLSTSSCMCICHEQISDVSCDLETESLTKSPLSTTWISYVNTTSLSGYIIYPNCPYDYCKSGNVSMNLNVPRGADAQCAFYHSGVLCGSCQQNLSLSLGSPLCLSCPHYWPVLLVFITIGGILVGLALVAVILILNMTVSVGTLNGVIFYANIVAAYSSALLPSSGQNFATVVIAWLNLDIGIDSCYFPGMDAFSKTWLQLAFPLYMIFLVLMVIVTSSRSTRFSNLLGKKNPVATLATLILLSYTKILTIVLKSMTFGTLVYPDGSLVLVWLPDASVKFLDGKHIALFIMAVFLLLIGLIYTILLFSWQWLLRLPKWKAFSFVRHPKLNTFIQSYSTPCTPKHRYWTGLLLLIRIVLVLSAQINSSNDPRYSLASVVCVIVSILFLKGIIGIRVYKEWPLDILDTVFYFNIAIFSTLTLATDHDAIAYVSVGVAFILLLMIIFYHMYAYCSAFSKVRNSVFGNKLNAVFKSDIKHKKQPKDDVYGSHELLDMMDQPNNLTKTIVEIVDSGIRVSNFDQCYTASITPE